MFNKVPKFRELKKVCSKVPPLLLTYTFLVPKLQVFFFLKKKTYLSRNKSGSTVAAKSKTEDK